MKAGTAARTSTLRMILARLKDIDIAARPKGIDKVPDDEVVGMLRGMVKSRRESVDLYRQGHRQDLVDKEEAEIAVIESFLPQQMDEAADGAGDRRGGGGDRRGRHQGDGQGHGRAAGEARRHAGHGQGRGAGEGAAVVRRRHVEILPLPLWTCGRGLGGGVRPTAVLGWTHPSPQPSPTRGGGEDSLMALSPAFLEELRSRTPLAAVIGRRVKLARSGRQMKGCCPFHNEKTPELLRL